MASYAEPKLNLTTQIAKCIGSGHPRPIVGTSSKSSLKPYHIAQHQFPSRQANRENALKPANTCTLKILFDMNMQEK